MWVIPEATKTALSLAAAWGEQSENSPRDNDAPVEIGGKAVDGCYFSNHYSPDDPDQRGQAFISKYKSKYGEIPDAMAVLGYDAANVLADAMKRAGSADRSRCRT